jgi:DNA invertase Pin-like site-specific DNA recombinase
MKKAALYFRVSTSEQTPDAQIYELRDYISSREWVVVGEFVDVASGAVRSRPELDRLMAEMKRGRIDIVVCWAFDRLARSVRHLCEIAEELEARNVDLVSFQQALDTSTPSGRFTFHILAAVAEFERDMIRERVRAGMAAAKAKGRRLGRRKSPMKQQNQIRRLRVEGKSFREIAAEVGVSVGTAVSYVKASRLRGLGEVGENQERAATSGQEMKG